MQRLIVISPSNFPGTSGDTTNYLELTRAFKRKGLDVVLVCPWHLHGRSFDMEMKKQGIMVRRVRFKPPRLTEIAYVSIFKLCLKLLAFYAVEAVCVLYWILKEKPDLIFVRYGILTFPVSPLLKCLKIRNMADVYELPTAETLSVSHVYKKLCLVFDKKLLGLYQCFRTTNCESLKFLQQLGVPKAKILLSYPGIDLDRAPKAMDLTEIPPATFGFFGRLERWQGVDVLIKAFFELNSARKDAVLYIIGDGSLRDKLKETIENVGLRDKVIFVEPVPRDVLWREYFPKFRVLVIPRPKSTSSSLVPMKLIETLCAGKVVISTPIKPIEEVLRSCAIIVPYSDVSGLAKAMLNVCQNEELQLKLSKKAKETSELFNVNKTVCDIIAFKIMERS